MYEYGFLLKPTVYASPCSIIAHDRARGRMNTPILLIGHMLPPVLDLRCKIINKQRHKEDFRPHRRISVDLLSERVDRCQIRELIRAQNVLLFQSCRLKQQFVEVSETHIIGREHHIISKGAWMNMYIEPYLLTYVQCICTPT